MGSDPGFYLIYLDWIAVRRNWGLTPFNWELSDKTPVAVI